MIVNVQFFLRGKGNASSNQSVPIYAQVDIDGVRSTAFATRMKVPPMYWMVDKARKSIKASSLEAPVSPSYYLSDDINEKISAIRKAARDAKNLLIAINEVINPTIIKELLTSKKKLNFKISFMDALDELVNVLAVSRRKSTMLTYRTRRNNIAEYFVLKGMRSVPIDQIRYAQFEDLQYWMTTQKNEDDSPRWGRNTINKHLTMVNQVLNYAVNKEYIRTNPIGVLGLEYTETAAPQYLRLEDRLRIENCTFATLTKEMDVAVFLMYTGLSYTDYLSLRDLHIYRLATGEYFIKKERDKSEVYSIVPLLPEAQKIISKYGSVEKLPRPDMSDLNKALKVLGEACKAPFSLSTSTFRETFSSMMENEYMIPDRLLMFMMGHTNIRQLRNYSRVMPERVMHELKKNDIHIPFNIELFKELVKAS